MTRLSRLLFGPAKDPTRPGAVHRLALVAFFAWVGLGADGLSSACYGPEEGFLALKEHHFLAIPLAILVILTVAILSASYAKIIELFPGGGGGYIVATRLLGKGPGLLSGSALVVDYALTVTISVASGVDQLFSFLPAGLAQYKVLAAVGVLALLTVLNLRGVKESILVLLPIFLLFVLTHALLIGAALIQRGDQLSPVLDQLSKEATHGAGTIGIVGLIGILFYAYTHGAGTYTGIEAVSDSMQILREPKVKTGKRTMMYMAISLSITAAGILIGYLLVGATKEGHRTLNATLFSRVLADWPGGGALVVVTLVAEGLLLFVAAQSGLIGGPRALAIMAHDRWVPGRFAHLSDRLVVADGVALMSLGAFAFLLGTQGDVRLLVVLYSINVFITFVLAQSGMCVHWLRQRRRGEEWAWGLTINGAGFAVAALILAMMVYHKFGEGGWITLLVTAALVGFCVVVRTHYAKIARLIRRLDERLMPVELPATPGPPAAKDPGAPTAMILVSGFNGLGVHAILTLHRLHPGHYKNFVFVSVGQVDYSTLQTEEEVTRLKGETETALRGYEPFVRALGGYLETRVSVSADVAGELETICLQVAREFPRAVIFAGQLVFERETPWTRLLHSFVTYDLQRRMHLAGMPLMILPVRMRE
jgi:amino acid transporter